MARADVLDIRPLSEYSEVSLTKDKHLRRLFLLFCNGDKAYLLKHQHNSHWLSTSLDEIHCVSFKRYNNTPQSAFITTLL